MSILRNYLIIHVITQQERERERNLIHVHNLLSLYKDTHKHSSLKLQIIDTHIVNIGYIVFSVKDIQWRLPYWSCYVVLWLLYTVGIGGLEVRIQVYDLYLMCYLFFSCQNNGIIWWQSWWWWLSSCL